MSINDTSWRMQRYALYGAYLTEGIVIGCANLLVALSLLYYEATRTCNRHMFVIAQSIADFINMLAYATCGAYRIGLLWSGTHNTRVSLWECALVPHRLLWGLWGDRLVTLVQLLIAIDRLLSVSLPLQYIGWGSVYPLGLISISYSCITLFGLIGLHLESLVSDHQVSKACTNAVVRAAGDAYGWYYQMTAQIYSVISLGVFGMVALLYHRQVNAVVHPLNSVQLEQLKQQRRFTKSLALNSLASVVFYVLPFTLGHMSDRFGWGRTLATVNFIISNLYPLCDVIIFVVRHEEMRQAIGGFCKRKSMPADLRLWKANATARGARDGVLGSAPIT